MKLSDEASYRLGNIKEVPDHDEAFIVSGIQALEAGKERLDDSVLAVWGKLTQRDPAIGGHVAHAVESVISALEAELDAFKRVNAEDHELMSAISADLAQARADIAQMRDKIAEFIDGESHGETHRIGGER